MSDISAPATTSTTAPEAVEPPAAAASPTSAPSVHVRAVVTWLAIFPMVSIGMLLLAPISESWHPVLRSLVLTAIVVPLAVYLVVPRMLQAHGALVRATRRR